VSRRWSVVGALATVLAGCGVPETGIPPPHDTFYFPVGLAPHPDGRYLYVSNAGFDRRYNAGTVQVFDTFTRRVLSAATVETGLFAGELVVARFGQPALSIDEPYVARVAGGRGTFTLTLRNGGSSTAREVGVLLRVPGTVTETTCAGAVDDSAVGAARGGEVRYRFASLDAGTEATFCGAFDCTATDCADGDVQLAPVLTLSGRPYEPPVEAPATAPVRALLTTREDDRLTWFDIDASRADGPGHLDCGAGDAPAARCDASHQIDSLTGVSTRPGIGPSPYGFAVDRTGFYLTHVKRGELSRWRFTETPGVGPVPEGACRLTLTRGASAVARHPLLGWAYVSDRSGELVSTVATLDPLDRGLSGRISAEQCRLEERSPLVVDADPGQGRTRGLAFSADGTLLYVATGSDAALHVYDTSIAANGRPRQTLLGAIPLGFGPNVVRVAGLRTGEVRAGDGLDGGDVAAAVDARGEGLVYVSTFDDDALLVVDPALMAVIARIPTGTGPHDIAFMPDADGRLMAWVSNFRDHSLTLVDIDPDSPRRFTAVAQLR
jgi:YVTN family beta-propeller protein